MNFLKGVVSAGLVGVVLVAAPGYAAAAAPQSESAKSDDSALKSRIAANLKANSVLAPRDIDVDVEAGVVTLRGKVRTVDDRAVAGSLANISGVSRLNNRIEVDPKIDDSKIDAAAHGTKKGLNKAVDATATAAKKTEKGVEKGVGKTEEGVGKAAEKTAEGIGKAGDKLGDASVTTRVKANFTDEKLLKDSSIDVDTHNHVVTLKGTVDSSAAKARAASIAAGTDGVSRVENMLVVRNP